MYTQRVWKLIIETLEKEKERIHKALPKGENPTPSKERPGLVHMERRR